jgi:hypothetical protein
MEIYLASVFRVPWLKFRHPQHIYKEDRMRTVAIEVEANIAEFAAMRGVTFDQAAALAKHGGYFKILETIHKGKK